MKGSATGRGTYGGLGKRHREDQVESSGSETDESVRRIPWPKDTPPSIPRQRHNRPQHATNANSEPLGVDRRSIQPQEHTDEGYVPDTALPAKPTVKTTYESAPQIRDLKKEATARFVPTAVRRKIDVTKGKGGALLEEEEVEKLEKEGYGAGTSTRHTMSVDPAPQVAMDEDAVRRLQEEEERFARELGMEEQEGKIEGPKAVMMEEVSDEDV